MGEWGLQAFLASDEASSPLEKVFWGDTVDTESGVVVGWSADPRT